MKNEKLIASWNRLEPSGAAELRMRTELLEQNRRVREKRELARGYRAKAKRLLPAVACLAVLLAAVGLVRAMYNGMLLPLIDDNTLPILKFNNSYYEITDERAYLERRGLPAKLTAEQAGGHVAYLQPGQGAGEADYEVSDGPTEIELLEYAPAPCKGVYIVRNGRKYSAALFANVLGSVRPMTQLYQIYGIEAAEDIASITETDEDGDQVLGEAITDQREIEAFYTASLSMSGYGSLPDKARDEEIAYENHKDHRYLWIETKGGLRFLMDVYPSFGFLYASGVMTYYEANEPMTAWIARNMR